VSSDATTTDRPAAAEAAVPHTRAPGRFWSEAATRAAAAWEHIERFLVRAGDWLNPILVKETRQAIKSFQFTITFVLVLIACWVVTIGGVAIIGPRIFYSASGGTMLTAYYVILAFPLAVVVPYAAFRSLAAEREDNTYELLSITTLRPRQIISGKLGSSIVQMAVYFSAITPCLAFTYLLRGVDLPTIAIMLVYTFFGSLGLSMVGILLATLSEQRFAQVFVSVALVAFLLFVFWGACLLGGTTVQYSYSFIGDEEFWIATLAMATAYVTTFALAYFAAAGMITFTSENRSTPLRIGMLVQQAAWIGWMGYAWIQSDFRHEVLLIMAMMAGIYWYFMGTLLTAEKPQMSERMRRRLPTTTFGRANLTWLNPGPATGYMFVVANATAVGIVCILGMIVGSNARPGVGGWPGGEELFFLLVIGWGYLVAYLGLGMLIVSAVRHIALVTMLANVLIHFLVVLAGSGIPTVIQLMSPESRYEDYTFLQVTNPFWSLVHISNGNLNEAYVLIFLVPTAAICVLLLNFRNVVRELQQVRTSLPARVAEDEAQLHPVPLPQPTNPWEEQ
jgi:hypothetical protein